MLIAAMQRQYSGAVELLKEASRVAKEDKQREQIDMNRALIHGINGELIEAENIASKYLKDSALKNNLGLYAYLANNRDLAKSYLDMALAGTQVYYKRAWENIDIINKKEDAGVKSSPVSSQPASGKRVKINQR